MISRVRVRSFTSPAEEIAFQTIPQGLFTQQSPHAKRDSFFLTTLVYELA